VPTQAESVGWSSRCWPSNARDEAPLGSAERGRVAPGPADGYVRSELRAGVPMGISERLSRLSNRLYDRMRDRRAFELRLEDADRGSFDGLRGHKYAVLVTFRRNGAPVPSPVWFGLDAQGRAYVRTMHDAGKVKRVRNDPRALLAPSTVRGRPIGAAIEATALVVPRAEWSHAETTLQAAYGIGRKVYEGAFGGGDGIGAYLELTPTASP
jgi:uncharacterized protein